MFQLILLAVHIAAGSVSLAMAGVALVTAKGGRWHVLAGRIYAVGMTLVFVTAIPLAIFAESIFLFLIALFSFYLVFAGWRFARNRQRRAHPVDWIAVSAIGVTGSAMLVLRGCTWLGTAVRNGSRSSFSAVLPWHWDWRTPSSIGTNRAARGGWPDT